MLSIENELADGSDLFNYWRPAFVLPVYVPQHTGLVIGGSFWCKRVLPQAGFRRTPSHVLVNVLRTPIHYIVLVNVFVAAVDVGQLQMAV